MTTYTVAALLFGWGVQPWVWIVLLFCAAVGTGAQYALIKRCSRWRRWVFPAVLAAFWLVLELLGQYVYNGFQMTVLFLLGAVLAGLAGALVGAAAFAVIRAASGRQAKG